jgi:hypothetical protein
VASFAFWRADKGLVSNRPLCRVARTRRASCQADVSPADGQRWQLAVMKDVLSQPYGALNGLVLAAFSIALAGCNEVQIAEDDGAGGSGTSAHTSTAASGIPGSRSASSSGTSMDPCELVVLDPDVTEVCTTPTSCEVSGRLGDGRPVVEVCTSSNTCTLFVDGAVLCECPLERIDFNQSCSNGIPTCAGWSFSWDRVDTIADCDVD